MACSKSYEFWDKIMAARNPDYPTLVNQMVAVAHSMVSGDVELWWRLAAGHFGLTYNMDFETERDSIRAKTVEAKHYAEKALKADPNHFEANLWMATCLGQLALLEVANPEACLALIPPLINHLTVAVNGKPDNWRVLLLESQLQMTLHQHPAEMRAYANRLPPNLVLQDLATVEGKLRRVIEQNANSHEAYLGLASALYLQGKYSDAMAVGQQGLALEHLNRGEQYVARILESFLPDVARKLGA